MTMGRPVGRDPLKINLAEDLRGIGFAFDILNECYTLEVKSNFTFAKDLLERKLDINAIKVMVSNSILSDTRINLADKFKINKDILNNL